VDVDDHLHVYGCDADAIRELVKFDTGLGERLHPSYPFMKAEVIWAVRHEMAMTIEDILARRIRLLFLDARAAVQVSGLVGELMAKEMGKGDEWVQNQVDAFNAVASNYILAAD
jgi:glycerol-3-phosphate dehydrogenase